ncbi:hypothetical protein AAFC00_001736 [Neodothiora populina]
MPLFTFLFSLLFIDFSIAGYVLEDDYSPSKFFDMFSFFTWDDPTHGFVKYVDRPTAASSGFISTTGESIYIGADYENITPNGRPSVRLTSNKAYNAGSLIVLDLSHMPGGICGTWPAFWMVGPDWPSSGEIDIIEGVNLQSANSMALHTNDGCSITNNGNFTGSINTDDCYVQAADQSYNAGCSISSSNSDSYGTDFNGIGGGVYAVEWTEAAINIWFFTRYQIPSDIAAGNPSPSAEWGTPTAQFQGGCDIPEFFHDNQIVFDLTFCGDWAGNVWESSTCSGMAPRCDDYVANNPAAFKNAYWSINSLQVFQYSDVASPVTSSAAASSTSAEAQSSSLPVYPTSTAGSSTSSERSSSSSTSSAAMSSESSSQTSSSQTSSSSSDPSSTSSGSSGSSTSTGTSSSSSSDRSSSSATGTSSRSSSSSNSSSSPSSSSPSLSSSSSSSSSGSSSVSTSATASSSRVSSSAASSSASRSTGTSASTSRSSAPTPNLAGDGGNSVPTSVAEMLAKVEALADDWSSTAPAVWQDNVNELEDTLEVAASQAAAVSAKLRQNQRRHLLHHKRRLSGHF